VVVDAASDDETKAIALKYKDKLPLRFFDAKRRNVSYQRNFGAKQAKGEYLLFLDADSRISRAFTKRLKEIIEKEKGLVFLPSLISDEKSPETEAVFTITNRIIEASQALGRPLAPGGTLIIAKFFFDKLGGFKENLFIGEDHDILRKVNVWGVKAKFLKKVKVKFSMRRAKNEGRFKLLYKYMLAVLHIIFKGKVENKIFQYEMGGHLYRELKRKKDMKDYVTKIKHFFSV
ncbi:glycosyltransferase, partial [Candidatus Roizmanbacteria bacterium]|nr:glycosyltransferase [Candidatus Roizmanbacteria bacterium]